MARERITVDMDALMVALYQRAIPAVDWRAASDVDVADSLPFGVVAAGQGQMVSNGPAGLAWVWTVHISIVSDDQELVGDLADELYEVTHDFHDSWSMDNRGTIVGVGAITSVEDISAPARTATSTTPAGDLTQYDGTFSITVRKA